MNSSLSSKKKSVRTRTISARVTEEEYLLFQELAVRSTPSEWARSVLVKAAGHPDPQLEAITAEVWAIRFILLNGVPALPTINAIKVEADEKKPSRARAILERALMTLGNPNRQFY